MASSTSNWVCADNMSSQTSCHSCPISHIVSLVTSLVSGRSLVHVLSPLLLPEWKQKSMNTFILPRLPVGHCNYQGTLCIEPATWDCHDDARLATEAPFRRCRWTFSDYIYGVMKVPPPLAGCLTWSPPPHRRCLACSPSPLH